MAYYRPTTGLPLAYRWLTNGGSPLTPGMAGFEPFSGVPSPEIQQHCLFYYAFGFCTDDRTALTLSASFRLGRPIGTVAGARTFLSA
jgi:hypothetical protein